MAKKVPKYLTFIQTQTIDVPERFSDEIKCICIKLMQRSPEDRPSTRELIELIAGLPLFQKWIPQLEDEIDSLK